MTEEIKMQDVEQERREELMSKFFIQEGIEGTKPVIKINLKKIKELDKTLAEFLINNTEKGMFLIRATANNPTVEIIYTHCPVSIQVGEALKPEYNEKIIEVTGIIQTVSPLSSYPSDVTWQCDKCKGLEVIQYYPFDYIDKTFHCKHCKKSTFHKISSKLVRNFQYLTIAEQQTSASAPNMIDVIVPEYLVDSVIPEKRQLLGGNKIKVTGIMSHLLKGKKSILKPLIHCLNWEAEKYMLEITTKDISEIKEASEDPDILNKLIESFSPSVHGYKEIKEAILLQMVGGVRRITESKKMNRGSIHLLLVGDAGTGKTTMGNFVYQNYPKSRYITGSEISSAGISASLFFNKDLNMWIINSGAMVLAHKSVLVFDEADKAKGEDLKALDVVMELQELPVDKAGISARLPAETSILAIANPQFGRFDTMLDLQSQIRFPDTTLSRFDLKFILKDKPDEENDKMIYKAMLHPDQENPPFTTEFLMKYLHYSRQTEPELTEECINSLENFYLALRKKSGGTGGVMAITSRQVESLRRLTEAFAKLHLRDKTHPIDVERAIELFKFYLKEMGLDVEHGKFDIDQAEGRTSAKGRSQISVLMEEIESLTKVFGTTPFPKDDLISTLVEKGMKKEWVESNIDKLKESGKLFEPKNGFLLVS
jgi:replicative DNA helicase Mcm